MHKGHVRLFVIAVAGVGLGLGVVGAVKWLGPRPSSIMDEIATENRLNSEYQALTADIRGRQAVLSTFVERWSSDCKKQHKALTVNTQDAHLSCLPPTAPELTPPPAPAK